MAPTQPSLSVVMPFYNNERTLLPSLRSFIEQLGATASEILVVDDGQEPKAHAIIAPHVWPLPVRVLRSGAMGQSAATNIGIRQAQGQIVLLTCADIIATPTLLQAHLEEHQRGAALGVMGPIRYAPWVHMSPIMQFLAMPGVQFDFDNIQDTENVPAKALYAPNVSMEKKYLMEVGGFDEALTYGYQDCDLGLRLAQVGVRFVYRAQALVWHDHPNSVRGYVQRQQRINKFWPLMAKRYPELAKVDIMSKHLDHYVPQLGKLDHLTSLAERADARFGALETLTQGDLAKLFALFDTLSTLATVQGVVSNLADLQEVLDVGCRPWYAGLSAPGNAQAILAKGPN